MGELVAGDDVYAAENSTARFRTAQDQLGRYRQPVATLVVCLEVAGVCLNLVDGRMARLAGFFELEYNDPAILQNEHIRAAPRLARKHVFEDSRVRPRRRIELQDFGPLLAKGSEFLAPGVLLRR